MKNIIIALVALVVGLGIGFSVNSDKSVGSIRLTADKFAAGLTAGKTEQFTVSNGGAVTYRENVVAKTATTTITANQSGTTFSIGTNGGTYTLPAVTNTGAFYRFVIGAAYSGDNVIIDSAEGDNIEGTLIVAGAVVDCNAVDQINSIADGENVGDFVEVRSNGTNWIIGASGVLTTAKMTCTDPS